MSAQFFSKLSQNYIELLKDDEYYDIIIEVGEDPSVKIFHAHMNILCNRSPYLRRILASNKKNSGNDLAYIKLPNASSEIFQIILEYIYGGILSLDEKDDLDLLKVLGTADKLNLQELVEYLQEYLIENKSEWLEQHFEFTQQISSQSNDLSKLQEFSIKSDDLQMKEIEVWEHVLKWGFAQNPTLIPDPKSWSVEDFKTMRNTLQHCLPLVRFFCLSSKEFSQKVRPYRKLLNQQLYEDLLNFFLESDNISSQNIQRPRNIKINEITNEIICSLIVNSGIVSTISKWIDKVDINDNNFKESNNYKDAILSYVKNMDCALLFDWDSGPYFGSDIVIYASSAFIDYNKVRCNNCHYEKQIRDSNDYFNIEDYEVFQRIKR
ncbi:BTB/POZ protein [Rhizophagus clarus]|uniref:BTB/POZ protein n=1 Tax=Rhizophagus clarus TaxID=94130 RepID=A0A8H3LWI9_9GLOM|nr:BTB/POZ protein [Rhizophagus clarus]